MHHLPPSTVRLIGSTQVITSVYSVVKELVENSIDAGATIIDVKLDKYGLGRIEVRDNGSGIKSTDMPFVGQRYYTSKIQSHEDLESLITYGFRGEALGSLCTVSDVSVTTKTEDDDISTTYTLDHQGQITGKKPSHFGKGTTITAQNLFKSLPVRKQFYNTNKKKKEEIKKTEDILTEFGIIRPEIRFTFRHEKDLIWQKNVLPDLKSVLLTVFGRTTFSQLEYREICSQDPEFKMEVYLPCGNSDVQQTSRASKDRMFTFVNKRPVVIKEIEKLFKEYYQKSHQYDGIRYPLYVLSIITACNQVDVNLDPNKERVMLHDKEEIIASLEMFLTEFYAKQSSLDNQKITSQKDIYETNRDVENKGTGNLNSDRMNINGENNLKLPDSDQNHKILLGKNNSSSADEKQTQSASTSSDLNFDLVNSSSCLTGENSLTSRVSPMTVNEGDAPSQVVRVGNFDIDFFDTSVCTDAADSELPTTASKEVLKSIGPKCSDINNKNADMVTSNCDHPIVLDDDVIDKVLCTFPSSPTLKDNVSPLNQIDSTNRRGEPHSADKSDKTSSVLNPECGSAGGEWSKGHALIGDDGLTIQPVTLLAPEKHHTPGKRPPSPTHNSLFISDNAPPKKRMSIEQGQTTMYDLIGSQPVKRPESPFSLYSKKNRQKVVEENPNSSFDEISQIIDDSWQKLTENEKKSFETQASSKQIRYQERVQQAKKHSLSTFSKKKLTKLSTRERLLESPISQKQKSKHQKKRISDITFNLQILKSRYDSWIRSSQYPPSEKFHLIGPLKSCQCWVFDKNEEISLLNTHRVEEVVLHEKLMKSHSIPTEKLDKPHVLNERSIGDSELWNVLKQLIPNTWNEGSYCNILDDRIVKNGFEIRFFKDESSQEFGAEIKSKAKDIPTYGMNDLIQILRSIRDGSMTLYSTRPTKVVNYLKSEAVRMSRQFQVLKTKEDVQQMISQLELLSPSQKASCLHNKPFYHVLFNVGLISSSQDDTVTLHE